DVLQTGPFAQRIVGQIEDVIRFVKGHMDHEQVQALVDAFDQAKPPCQGMQGADAAMGQATVAVSDLIVNVRSGKHRPVGPLQLGFVQASLNAPLASVELLSYLKLHSKSPFCQGE